MFYWKRIQLIRFLLVLGILLVLTFDKCQANVKASFQQGKANQTKQARTNFNEQPYNGQQVWNPNNRFELTSMIPSVIIFAGLLLLLIPMCLSLFTPLFYSNTTPYVNNPWYGYHGRKKREIINEINKKAKSFGLIQEDFNFDNLISPASSILHIVTKLGKSLQKFAK